MQRNVLRIVLSLVLVLGIAAAAGAQAKPLVVLVNNLDNEYWISFSGKFDQLADELIDAGYDIDERGFDSFNAGNLAGIKILVFAMPDGNLPASDIAALKTFIQNGGAVLVMVDDDDYYPWIEYDDLNNFVQPFGITIGSGEGSDPVGTVVATSPFAKPEAIAQIRSYEGRRKLTVNSQFAKVDSVLSNGTNFIVHSVYRGMLGKGRLVVIGESRWLTDDPGVGQIRDEDNTPMVRNIFAWLAGKGVNLQMKKNKVVGSNLSAGSTITVKGTVKNLGTAASPATKVNFVLVSTSGAPYEGTIKTITLQALNAGALAKITQKIKLPGNLPAATYVLTAVVDPEYVSGDVDLSNNAKNSKQITVQ